VLGNVTYCPACWGPATMRIDKHGRPYLRCGSGCRMFTNGPDALGALTVVSDWIAQSLARMETDSEYCEAMRGVVTQQRRNLRSALSVPAPAPAMGEAKAKVG
jgi:hypothetical protein